MHNQLITFSSYQRAKKVERFSDTNRWRCTSQTCYCCYATTKALPQALFIPLITTSNLDLRQQGISAGSCRIDAVIFLANKVLVWPGVNRMWIQPVLDKCNEFTKVHVQMSLEERVTTQHFLDLHFHSHDLDVVRVASAVIAHQWHQNKKTHLEMTCLRRVGPQV